VYKTCYLLKVVNKLMPRLVHIEVEVPKFKYSQSEIAEFMIKLLPNDKGGTDRIIKAIYDKSGVSYRYSVLPDYRSDQTDKILFDVTATNSGQPPSTKARNDIFVKCSKVLAYNATKRLFANYKKILPQEVTHLITVSCTGFENPNVDQYLLDKLEFSPNIQRFNIGFMGCYAGFQALKMAHQFCLANNSSKVLIICSELCTLHFNNSTTTDTILANAIFADGVAVSLIVANNKLPEGFETLDFHAKILNVGKRDMSWSIGDYGFNMVLTKEVPNLIEQNIEEFLTEASLKMNNLPPKDQLTWAIHPGGKRILDLIEKRLNLHPKALSYSRTVLRDFGNMSSATIFFVLKEILKENNIKNRDVLALGFGPGLGVESAYLRI
jgi:predicted naringenin-chalcone synthase